MPVYVLDTLEIIFGMNFLDFDLGSSGAYLFGARNQDNVNENWIDRIVEMLNNLIEYNQTIRSGVRQTKFLTLFTTIFQLTSNCSFLKISKIPEYWPIAVFLLAFTCGLYFLEKNHTKDEHNLLTDDQKNKFKTYLRRLHEILDNICQNLKEKQLDSFSGK